jgi:hypothetical protein
LRGASFSADDDAVGELMGQADLRTNDADNQGIARLHHLDPPTLANAECLEARNITGGAPDFGHHGSGSGAKLAKRQASGFKGIGDFDHLRHPATAFENESQSISALRISAEAGKINPSNHPFE